MEDIIAYALMVIVPVVVFLLVRAGARYFERRQQERDEADRKRVEQYAAEQREYERARQKQLEASKAYYSQPATKPVSRPTATVAPAYAPSPTQSVNTWSNDPLTTMIITDMLLNHKDVSAGTVTWDNDTPTVKETYSKPSTPSTPSFGFDDNDSRKSSSSTFSSSDSSSSWSSSDSSSSSSDSGPSSDW